MSPTEDEEKPFLAHLDELRAMLIACVSALALGVLVAIPLAPTILDLLKVPLATLVPDPDRYLQSLQVAGAFTSTARMSFWSGLVLSLPWMVFFVARFIFPGLTPEEKRIATASGLVSVVLFIGGVLLGYFISLEVALTVMHGIHRWLGVEPMWTLSSYVTFCIHLLLGFGLAFQLPVLVYTAGRLGFVDTRQLASKRRHVFVGLLIFAMFLTPPDPFTQCILTIPLYLLYEVCILFLRIQGGKR